MKDTFDVYPTHIQVNSKSGATYTITLHDGLPTCTCKGFGYYGHCRHIDEAKAAHPDQFVLHDDQLQEPVVNEAMLHNVAILTGKAPIPHRQPPYPWCYDKPTCTNRGYCTKDPSCGN